MWWQAINFCLIAADEDNNDEEDEQEQEDTGATPNSSKKRKKADQMTVEQYDAFLKTVKGGMSITWMNVTADDSSRAATAVLTG